MIIWIYWKWWKTFTLHIPKQIVEADWKAVKVLQEKIFTIFFSPSLYPQEKKFDIFLINRKNFTKSYEKFKKFSLQLVKSFHLNFY